MLTYYTYVRITQVQFRGLHVHVLQLLQAEPLTVALLEIFFGYWVVLWRGKFDGLLGGEGALLVLFRSGLSHVG